MRFDDCRKRIYRKEWVSFIILMITNFWIIVLLSIITILQPLSDKSTRITIHAWTATITFTLCINEYIVFRKTMMVLRKTLNFYYHKRYKMMRRTTIINIWFLSAFFIFEIFRMIFPVEFASVWGFYPDAKLESTFVRIVYLAGLMSVNFPWYLYVYANITKMNFKDWMIGKVSYKSQLSIPYQNCFACHNITLIII